MKEISENVDTKIRSILDPGRRPDEYLALSRIHERPRTDCRWNANRVARLYRNDGNGALVGDQRPEPEILEFKAYYALVNTRASPSSR